MSGKQDGLRVIGGCLFSLICCYVSRAIKQEADLKTPPMVAMTSLESMFSQLAKTDSDLPWLLREERIDRPDDRMTGDQPVRTVRFQKEPSDNEI